MKNYLFLSLLFISWGILNAQEVERNVLGQTTTQSSSEINNQKTTEDPALWSQPVSTANTKFSIVSTYYNLGNWGMFCADDFELTEESAINSILFYGSQSAENGPDFINGINLYIYEDNMGVPAGNPIEEGAALYDIIGIPYDSEFVTVEPGVDPFLGNKIYQIDLKGYLGGVGIILPAGHYWLSIVFDVELEVTDFDIRWLWSDSETGQLDPPVAIAPVPEGDIFIENWTAISEIGFPMVAFAFTLYGEGIGMSNSDVNLNNLQVYPNPVNHYLFLGGISPGKVLELSAINLVGQKQILNFQNGRADVSMLKSGTYIVQIKTENGTITRKMIKK